MIVKPKIGSENDAFKEDFDDGMYAGVIVGIRYGEAASDDGKARESNCFLLAVEDEKKNVQVKKSKEFSCASLNQKGNFAQYLASIFKLPLTEADLYKGLVEMGVMTTEGLDMAQFLGMKVNVSIKMQVSTKDPAKSFANVAGLFKHTGRFGDLEAPEKGFVPSFYQTPFNGKMTAAEFLPGWGWREVGGVDAAPVKAPDPIVLDSDIPF